MTNLKDIEKVGRQAWLATIGTYAKGWDIISGQVSTTFDDANKFVNDMIENGEKIETDFKEKVKNNIQLDEKISLLKVKLGVDTSTDDKLAELNKKVSLLTDEIEKIVDARLAALTDTVQAAQKPVEKLAITETEVPVKKVVAKKAPAKAVVTKPVTQSATKTAVKKTPVKAAASQAPAKPKVIKS